jgi:hypothetical protein
MPAFIKTLISEEFEFCCIFHFHPPGDLALEIGGVGPQGFDDGGLLLAQQGFHKHRRVAQVRRHAHFRYRNRVSGQHIIMDIPALEDFTQHMAHLFPNAKDADGWAGFGQFKSPKPGSEHQKGIRLLLLPVRPERSRGIGSSVAENIWSAPK